MKQPSRLSRALFVFLALCAVVAGLAVVAACGGDDDGDDDEGASEAKPAATIGKLEIFDPWVRTTTNDVSAGYFVVKNGGPADTLVKATANITGKAQLHEVVTEGASSKMQEKPGGFPVPANGELTLKAGGYHVMLMDIKAPLKEGDTVELELQFEKAGLVKLTAPVKPGAATTSDMPGGMSGGMGGASPTAMSK